MKQEFSIYIYMDEDKKQLLPIKVTEMRFHHWVRSQTDIGKSLQSICDQFKEQGYDLKVNDLSTWTTKNYPEKRISLISRVTGIDELTLVVERYCRKLNQ